MEFNRAVVPQEIYPKRPEIIKTGTICCDLVETSPIVFKGDLYRLEYVRGEEVKPRYKNGPYSYTRLVNMRTHEITPGFAYKHQFGSGFADGDVVYSTGIRSNTKNHEAWNGDTIDIYRSYDLQEWELISTISLPGWEMLNSNVCKKGDTYTLLIEIAAPLEECGPKPFTFRFFQSKDMINWEMTPQECVFNKDRYAGSPSIYAFEDDPYYYVGYLEEYPNECYAQCIARSKDLKEWEYSPINPILMYNEKEDKKTANLSLSRDELDRIDAALDINNSDMELCDFNGRTIIFYSWGDQHGNEFYANAYCDMPLKEFLQAYFKITPMNKG